MAMHTYSSWNSPEKPNYKKFNEMVYIILTACFGITYPFFVINFAKEHPGVFLPTALEEFTLIGNVFIFGLFLLMILVGFLNNRRKKKMGPNVKKFKDYKAFCKDFLNNYEQKNSIRRKYSHVLPGILVIFVILSSYSLKPILLDAWKDYAFFIIIVIGIDFAFAFLLEDIIRLLAFDYMPYFVLRLCREALYPDELDTFSSTFVMVFSFGFFILVSFPIFFIVLLVSSIGDAMSSVVGITYSHKKHNFPKNTRKTIEGYIGGTTFSFLSAIFGVLFSNWIGFSDWPFQITLLAAVVASITFLGIDILTSITKLQDNYLNSFGVGLTLILLLSLYNIPIF